MTEDVFAAPDTATGNEPGSVKHDKWGRYLLPDPKTGKIKGWTRVSTLAHTLSDTFHLDRWNSRMVAKGMGLRPDLAMLAANLDVTEDRDALQDVAEKAKEAAGGSVGANLGTALHGYAERLDRGEDLSQVRMADKTRKSLDAYRASLRASEIEMVPEMMERVILNRTLGVVGRLDRMVMSPYWNVPRIGDLKTQKTLDFGTLEIGIQLACYAHADLMWNEQTQEWEEFPEVDLESAIIMHFPAEKDFCEIIELDIDAGWQCARLAYDVRKTRRTRKVLHKPYVNDGKWRARIRDARSVDDLSSVWRDAKAAGQWTRELQALGMKRRDQIKGESQGSEDSK